MSKHIFVVLIVNLALTMVILYDMIKIDDDRHKLAKNSLTVWMVVSAVAITFFLSKDFLTKTDFNYYLILTKAILKLAVAMVLGILPTWTITRVSQKIRNNRLKKLQEETVKLNKEEKGEDKDE